MLLLPLLSGHSNVVCSFAKIALIVWFNYDFLSESVILLHFRGLHPVLECNKQIVEYKYGQYCTFLSQLNCRHFLMFSGVIEVEHWLKIG